MDAVGLSHPGLSRPTNEDAYAVRPDLGLFVVADGMGGAAAGEVASRMAIDTVREMFEQPDAVPGLPLLVAGAHYANACVHAAARADQTKNGMGTTLTALLVLPDRVAFAHVGDSRAYHLRGRRLDRITEDHTLVAELVRRGFLTAEEATTSQLRHMLQRAIGVHEQVTVDDRLLAVESGDVLLLTSDGVHGVVAEEEIAAILIGQHDLTHAAALLIEAANNAGGPDNATVVVVRVG
jgi:serine/threonine protein phosphatase PrpC